MGYSFMYDDDEDVAALDKALPREFQVNEPIGFASPFGLDFRDDTRVPQPQRMVWLPDRQPLPDLGDGVEFDES